MKIAFVGGGIGSLYAALMIKRKYPSADVTIFEKEERVGGRLAAVGFSDGSKIDEGPTIVLMPSKLKEQLQAVGITDLEILPIEPLYDLHFSDGTIFEKKADVVDQTVAIERQFGEGAAFQRYMHEKSKEYDYSVSKLLERSYKGKAEMLQPELLTSLLRMRAFESAYDQMGRYFDSEYLKVAYSFPTFYIGGNPYTTPSLYGLIPYREQAEGVWYIKGGYFSLAERIERELRKEGVDIRFGSRVERIAVEDGKADTLVANGETLQYDAIVLNGDFPLMEHLVEGVRPKKYVPSGGTLLLYFLIDGHIELPVHRFLMPNELKPLMRSIFEKKEVPEQPAVYLFHPSAIDDTLAAEGRSVLYALAPAPIGMGKEEYEQNGFMDRVKDRITNHLPGFDERIVEMKIRTPKDAEQFGLYAGGSFGIAPTMTQSAAFKTQAKPYPDIEGLYAVGASVHPCGGVPIVMMGATLLVERMEQEMGWKDVYDREGVRLL